MRSTKIIFLLIAGILTAIAPQSCQAAEANWDFTTKPMARIPAGTVVGGKTVEGWSDPVIFVRGQLTAGDVSAVSSTVQKYGEMFNLVVLANVKQKPNPKQKNDGAYVLDKVAIGFSTKIDGKDVIITPDTHKRLGAGLTWIGGSVFSANDAALKDSKQVARYDHGLIMDAPTLMLVNGTHQMRTVRHFFWISGTTGRLGTLVWPMQETGDGYECVGEDMQLLKGNLHEDRVMHVDGNEFNFVGLPSAKAFAVVKVPRGKSIPFNAELRKAASVKQFDSTSYINLLSQIQQAIQSAVAKPAAAAAAGR